MKRPLAVIGFCLFGACLLAGLASVSLCLMLFGCLFVLFVLAQWVPAVRSRTPFMAALLCAAAAFCFTAARTALVIQPLEKQAGSTVNLKAEVCDLPTYSGKMSECTVKVVAGDLPVNTKLKLYYTNEDHLLQPCEQVAGQYKLELTDNQRQARASGVILQAFASYNATVAQTNTHTLGRQLLLLRARIRDTIEDTLPGQSGALINAMCFGNRETLSTDTTDSFRGAGCSHLLAVSGLHTAIISAGLYALLRRLRMKKRAAALVSAGVLLLFMALNGFAVSVSRAGFMCLIMLAGTLFRREADSLNSLGAALTVFCILNPFAVWDLSLELSAGCTAGILLLYPFFRRHLLEPLANKLANRPALGKVAGKVAASVLVTAAATLPILPVQVAYFGEISVISPLTNLIAVPLAAPTVAFGCIGTLASLCHLPAAVVKIVFIPAKIGADLLHGFVSAVSRLPLTTLPITALFLQVWLLGTLAFLVAGWQLLKGRGCRIAGAVSVMVLSAGIGLYAWGDRGVVHITPATDAHSAVVLLQRDSRSALVLDPSSKDSVRSARTLLHDQHVVRLDFLLLTSLDAEGNRSLIPLLEDCPPDSVLCPGSGTYWPSLNTLVDPKKIASLSGSTATFWNDGHIRAQNGWYQLTCGQTSLLIAPASGDAAALPADWQQPDLLVFSQKCAENASLLRPQECVLCSTLPQACNEPLLLQHSTLTVRIPSADSPLRYATRRCGEISRLH